MNKKVLIGVIIAVLAVAALIFFGIVALIAVPNLSNVQNRSVVNADIKTAEQIGKAVKIWLIDAKSMDEVKARENRVTEIINYSELQDLEQYTSLDNVPHSLEDGDYYVVSVDGKIHIGIAEKASDLDISSATVDYDGSESGWAYIEGM